MPLINEFKHLSEAERPTKPKALPLTKAEYYIVEQDSIRYIHINTYSRNGSVVQTIQLSPKAIKQLLMIIAEEIL